MLLGEYDEWKKEKKCKKCDGSGLIRSQGSYCDNCDGLGFTVHIPIAVSETDLLYIQGFNNKHKQGQGWMAFVDWQMSGIDSIDLMDKGLIELHPDKPPKHGNYRDDFPESFYSLTLAGRLAVNYPSRFVAK